MHELEDFMISIALDGPAGAGKTTVAGIISKKLSIVNLDTGAMYRSVALKAIKNNIDTKNSQEIINMLNDTKINIVYEEGKQKIMVDDVDVSGEIRTPEVSAGASDVAKIEEVRKTLVKLQRAIASANSVIMDGRDIGTHVLPDANYKFFLTATTDERAKRRYLELKGKGFEGTYEEVKADIIKRDDSDINRAVSPLKQAEDAVFIDSTDMTVDEVVEKMLNVIER